MKRAVILSWAAFRGIVIGVAVAPFVAMAVPVFLAVEGVNDALREMS